MNKKVQELIRLHTKIRIVSFLFFWIGALTCINATRYVTDLYIQIGLLILVLSFFFFERANYHIGVLKGYDKGYMDSVKGHNYFVIYSTDDAEPEKKRSKRR